MQKFDGVERFSPADPKNLAEREIIELQFDNIPDKNLGLVIGARQTLMTTYILYQTVYVLSYRKKKMVIPSK